MDLQNALDDIALIRTRIAANALFQGFGPTVVALTGILALLAAFAQALFPATFHANDGTYLVVWIAVAIVAALMIGTEMVARSYRHHKGIATESILNAIEQFIPSGLAGAAVAAVIYTGTQQNTWMLPGLWQVFVALGVFAAVRTLPRAIVWVAAWYLASGLCVLLIASESCVLSPWMMGLPFGIGQLLTALILHRAEEGQG
jgi:hypothetical protein